MRRRGHGVALVYEQDQYLEPQVGDVPTHVALPVREADILIEVAYLANAWRIEDARTGKTEFTKLLAETLARSLDQLAAERAKSA